MRVKVLRPWLEFILMIRKASQGGGKIEASRGMMVPQFESTVFKLKVGEVSDIIETQYGYHIIKLISRKGDDYTCLHI